MLVPASIAKRKAVSLARMHHERLDLGPGLVIDRPGIELRSVLLADVAEGENECLIGCGSFGRTGELGIVPWRGSGILPYRCASLTGILHHNAESHLARFIEC
jgi:hypothetical protein